MPHKALYSLGILSTRSLCLPDFLVIGAPKAGTTWLAENLDCHPQIYMAKRPGCADPTEVRYFNQSFRLPLSYYSDLFLAGRDKVKGDKSPGYCTLPSYRIRFIRSVMPSVRLVLLIRDPVERAWSHSVMNLVKLGGQRIDQIPPSRFYEHFVRKKAEGCYTGILERWLNVFPEEQLYVGLYDLIADEPTKLLREVCTHIGADADIDWSQFPYRRIINPGQGFSMPDEYRRFLEDMYGQELAALGRRLGDSVARWQSAERRAG